MKYQAIQGVRENRFDRILPLDVLASPCHDVTSCRMKWQNDVPKQYDFFRTKSLRFLIGEDVGATRNGRWLHLHLLLVAPSSINGTKHPRIERQPMVSLANAHEQINRQ